MSTAVFVFASLLGGAAVASPFAYIAGRRSSREELAGAQRLIEAMNAAPARDDLAEVALPPERTGEHRQVELYDQDFDDGLIDWEVPPGNVISGGRPIAMTGERDTDAQDRELSEVYGLATWSGASHLQADPPADDTGEGTVAHLRSGEWAPATPAPKRGGQ